PRGFFNVRMYQSMHDVYNSNNNPEWYDWL
ncbi:MAG: hypothetical protein ACI8RD_002448, partial [Bacillariaceae sp.]